MKEARIHDSVSVDVLVLGAGIAGSRAALAACEQGASVAMVYKARGASPYAIAANVPLGHEDPRDSPERYVVDMLEGGYQINNIDMVTILANKATKAFESMQQFGVPFASKNGMFRQRHLSGNKYPRSVFVPEGTGKEVLAALDRSELMRRIKRYGAHEVIKIITYENKAVGALITKAHSDRITAVFAKATVVAMGGIGRLYADTTYPADVYGDGLAIALDAGALLCDMEFVQFEPVVTYWPEAAKGMEMPTAMLGDGAYLINNKNERFMFRYNPKLGELGIEKAKMALCIAREVAEGRGFEGGTVKFDTTVMDKAKLETYVHHCKRLRRAGIEPAEQAPLVRPAAHSIMGGIKVDGKGQTNVEGLFACGESAAGVHGASRIAGNGAGEALTMGWVTGIAAAEYAGLTTQQEKTPAKISGMNLWKMELYEEQDNIREEALELLNQVGIVLGQNCGLFRNSTQLNYGIAELGKLGKQAQNLRPSTISSAVLTRRVNHAIRLGKIIVQAALMRTESRGAHQRTDYPEQNDNDWLCNVIWSLCSDGSVTPEIFRIGR